MCVAAIASRGVRVPAQYNAATAGIRVGLASR
jgi:hypothetical protein